MTTNWLNIRPNSLIADLAPVWSREPVFEEMFNRVLGNSEPAGAFTFQNFKLNVAGDDANYYVYAMLPGIELDKLEVSVLDNKLTISGEFIPTPFDSVSHATENEKASSENNKATKLRWLYRELPTAPTHFHRELTLPVALNAEKVQAQYHNGILRILVPQAEAAKPHKIKVMGASGVNNQFQPASQPSQLEGTNQS